MVTQQYKTVRYDMRSCGKSAVATEPFSLLDDLHGLLNFLNIEKTYLLGLSMGGGLAIDYTLAHPERVDALIAVASGVSGSQMPQSLIQQIDEVDAALDNGDVELAVERENHIWTDGPHRTSEQVDSSVRKRVHEMNRNNYRLQANMPETIKVERPALPRLVEIHVPTLIIVGNEDVEHVQHTAKVLEEGIPGSKKVIIPETAHHLHMEKPEEFNQVVLDFLQSL